MTTKTPELEKMHEVREQSQPIGEFIDWLEEQGIRLMKYAAVIKERWPVEGYDVNGRKPYYVFRGRGPENGVHGPPEEYVDEDDVQAFPWSESVERMLARFFDIDLSAVEEERRALLDKMRERRAS